MISLLVIGLAILLVVTVLEAGYGRPTTASASGGDLSTIRSVYPATVNPYPAPGNPTVEPSQQPAPSNPNVPPSQQPAPTKVNPYPIQGNPTAAPTQQPAPTKSPKKACPKRFLNGYRGWIPPRCWRFLLPWWRK